MATAKQRAWRAEFARRYGKKKGKSKSKGTKRRNTRMAKGKRRRKDKAIPLGMAAPVVLVGYDSWQDSSGDVKAFANLIMGRTTGYYPVDAVFNITRAKMFWLGEGVGYVIGKVATKVGLNKHIKKLTMGYLKL